MHIFILLILLNQVFAQSSRYRDREIASSAAPAFLKAAVSSQKGIEDVEYFEKKYADGRRTFEVKYEVKHREVSLTYSEKGILIEKEEDTSFSDLSTELRKKIATYIGSRFQSYRVHETEYRTDCAGQKFIDVEVSDKSISGFLEMSFSPNGDYVSEEKEDAPPIETLN